MSSSSEIGAREARSLRIKELQSKLSLLKKSLKDNNFDYMSNKEDAERLDGIISNLDGFEETDEQEAAIMAVKAMKYMYEKNVKKYEKLGRQIEDEIRQIKEKISNM